jgi:hypothetical protein
VRGDGAHKNDLEPVRPQVRTGKVFTFRARWTGGVHETRVSSQIDLAEHRIRRKQVLGGLTHEYQIAA